MAEHLAELNKDNDTIYSTDEHIVGHININGTVKPLYEKIVDTGAIPVNSTKQVAHGISNISEIYSISGVTRWVNGADWNYQAIPNTNDQLALAINITVGNTYITILARQNSENRFTSSYVTIRYTKS